LWWCDIEWWAQCMWLWFWMVGYNTIIFEMSNTSIFLFSMLLIIIHFILSIKILNNYRPVVQWVSLLTPCTTLLVTVLLPSAKQRVKRWGGPAEWIFLYFVVKLNQKCKLDSCRVHSAQQNVAKYFYIEYHLKYWFIK